MELVERGKTLDQTMMLTSSSAARLKKIKDLAHLTLCCKIATTNAHIHQATHVWPSVHAANLSDEPRELIMVHIGILYRYPHRVHSDLRL